MFRISQTWDESILNQNPITVISKVYEPIRRVLILHKHMNTCIDQTYKEFLQIFVILGFLN